MIVNDSLENAHRNDLYNLIFSALHHNMICRFGGAQVRVLHVVSPISYTYTIKWRKLVQSRILLHTSVVYLYIFLYDTEHCTAAADLRCLLIGRSLKMACKRRIIILWYEGFHRFRVRLDHPCSRKRFPCVYTIHYTATPSSCRGDRPRRLRRV